MEINCVCCGNSFIPYHKKRSMYCSSACKNLQWYRNNKEKKDAATKARYDANPNYWIERTAKYREGRGSERWQKEKILIESSFERQTYKNLLTAIGRYIKDNREPKYGNILNMLQYSIEELKQHLLSTMPEGYIWEDFMNGKLHIDHIKPHSHYKYTSYNDAQYKECWGLSNLRLLSAKENMSKQNKI